LYYNFTDFTTPFNNTYSIYYDLLEPYIEILKALWNKLMTYFHDVTGDVKDLESIKSELSSQIKI